MWWIYLIVAVVFGGGGFFGGIDYEKKEQQKIPPKVIIHETKVTVDSKTTSEANANAYNVTILKDGQMFKYLTISTVGTNFTVSVISNKKESWKTNDAPTNK